jgi:gamma-glutamyl:cysteine ligase YbdK (ATP-grasp superfamily)
MAISRWGEPKMEELTIGIEEEYQIIDPETRELTSYISQILDKGAILFRDQVKPEFMQSQVEIGRPNTGRLSRSIHPLFWLRRVRLEGCE